LMSMAPVRAKCAYNRAPARANVSCPTVSSQSTQSEIRNLKTSLGIDSLSTKLTELVGIVTTLATRDNAGRGPRVDAELPLPCDGFDDVNEVELEYETDFGQDEVPADTGDGELLDFDSVPFSYGDGSMSGLPTSEYIIDEKTGPAINEELAKFTNDMCVGKSDVAKLLEKHPRPVNCDFVGAPRMNQEVWQVLPNHARTKDSNAVRAEMCWCEPCAVTTFGRNVE
jgi:hypothetical protein